MKTRTVAYLTCLLLLAALMWTCCGVSSAAEGHGDGAEPAEEPVAVSQESIDAWVRQLGDRQVGVREEATEALTEAGAKAVSALLEAQEDRDAEVRYWARRILREIEGRAAKELESHGAEVQWSDEGWVRYVSFRDHYYRTGSVADPGAEHLRALPHLEILELAFTEAEDEDLLHIRGLGKLDTLRLHHSQIGDEGLRHLTDLKGLWKLDVAYTHVTGTGLRYLKELPRLEYLSVVGPQVTDRSIAPIAGLTHLRGLAVGGQRVTDAGLVHLRGLASLDSLMILDTSITDKALVHLKPLTNLTHLSIQSEVMTDGAVEHLKELKSLRAIILRDTRVTPRGLQPLKMLPHLRNLGVLGTPRKGEELADLEKTLPGVRIPWDPF